MMGLPIGGGIPRISLVELARHLEPLVLQTLVELAASVPLVCSIEV